MKMKSVHLLPTAFAALVLLASSTVSPAGSPTPDKKGDGAPPARKADATEARAVPAGNGKASAGGILVKLKNPAGKNVAGQLQAMERRNLKIGRKFKLVPGLQRLVPKPGNDLRIQNNDSLLATVKELEQTGLYEYVEPDWIVHTLQAPTDSAYTAGTLWGLNNTGQNGGTAGVDVNALPAWGITTGSPSVVVGVIDTGIRYTHQDLSGNMWVNPGEIPGNGLDDDGNGFVDDVHGINAITGSGDPFDDNDHGTHCAGTIAATASDAGPHVGVAHNVKLMGLKFLSSSGSGATSDAITCIEYAVDMGVDILSNSWGGGGASQGLLDAIRAADDAGVLFVAAAGNSSSNNDITDNYPSNYGVANVIAVAAIDRTGALAGFSSYGSSSVDIGAPGVAIYSTTADSDSSYASFNGTSMATPHVAGAAALVVSQFPGIGITELRNRLLNTAAPLASLSGRVASGGMVDSHAALTITADGSLELRASSNGTLEAGASADMFVGVSDLLPVTGATVSGDFDGGAPVVFLDNGIAPDVAANDGTYSARLTVPADATTVTLNVQASAPGKSPADGSFPFGVLSRPPNDDFADRSVLAAGTTRTTGSNVFATDEAGEPRNPSAAGGRSVWWSWTAASAASVTISTSGSNFDTTLAIYQGTELGGLSLVGANDDSGGLQSAVTFAASAGATYQIQVDGYGGSQGDIELNYPSLGGGGVQSPVIVTQPVGRSVIVGDPFSLSVTANGAAPLAYEWRLDGAPIPGAASSTYSVPVSDETHEGSYTVVVSNDFGNATSNPAFVAVDPVGLIPENDGFANATALGGSSGTVSGSNIRAGGETSEPDHADASSPLASVWYRWTAPLDGILTVNTVGSDFDTTLAAYTGTSVASLVLVSENDDSFGLQSEVGFTVTAGTTYRFAVDGYSASEGAVSLNYLFVPGATTVPNDLFADRIALSGSQTASGTNIGASGESSEPSHAGVSSPLASAWWSWTAPSSGQLTVNTFGSDFDTALAVYTGTAVNTLTEIASNDDFLDRQSQVTVSVAAGTSYAIAVDGYAAAQGSITLAVVFTPDDGPPPGGMTALYFEDDDTENYHALSALENLGYEVTVVDKDSETFPADLTPFDLMVVEIYGSPIGSTDQNAIADFIAGGKPALINYWDLGGAPTLQAALGISVSQSISAPETLAFWQPADPVFEGLGGPLVPTGDNGGGDNGDKLEPLAGASALAGYAGAPAAGQAAIVRANEGRTIVNGFAAVDFNGPDMVALFENEIRSVGSGGGTGMPGTILLIEDQGGFGAAADVLTANGFDVTVVNNEFANGYATLLDGAYLSQFAFIVYGERGDGSGSSLPANVRASLENYIQNGGNLLVTGYDTLGSPTDPELAALVRALSPGDLASENPTWVVSNTDHPILNGPFGDLRGQTFDATGYDDDNLIPDTAAGAVELISTGSPRQTGKLIFTDLPGAGGSVGYWNGGENGSASNAQPDFSDGADVQAVFLNYASFAAGSLASPVITSPLTAYAGTDSPFSYQISADNAPTSYDASGLPAGLSIDTTTGEISGSVAAAGDYQITISATNPAGTGDATLELEIIQPFAYVDWPLLGTLPAGRRGELDRNGPLDMQNLIAFAMGLDPLNASAADSPAIVDHDTVGGTVTFRYRRAKFIIGTTLTPMKSTALDGWVPATVAGTTIVEGSAYWEIVDVTIPMDPGGRMFIRLRAE